MIDDVRLTDRVTMRLLRADDAPLLAAAYTENREYLRPWEPARDDGFFTADRQRSSIAAAIAAQRRGDAYAFVLVAGGAIVGRLNLTGVVRGTFQSGNLGYWVASVYAGSGLATAAVTNLLAIARDELALHRVQASVLPHNVGSLRVLEKTGFTRIGLARDYLEIDGRWQDQELFQVILRTGKH
jgi:ribosomal-protein-alanine N-acetyltransferase